MHEPGDTVQHGRKGAVLGKHPSHMGRQHLLHSKVVALSRDRCLDPLPLPRERCRRSGVVWRLTPRILFSSACCVFLVCARLTASPAGMSYQAFYVVVGLLVLGVEYVRPVVLKAHAVLHLPKS